MKKLVLLAAMLGVGACGAARTMDAYRADTQKMLDTRQGDIQTCYQSVLAKNASATGTVTVDFTVEKKTGAITNAQIDTAKTTAPKEVGDCVLQGVANLKLDPGDKNEGKASFSYEFKPQPAGA